MPFWRKSPHPTSSSAKRGSFGEDFWSIPLTKLCVELACSTKGLTSSNALKRVQLYGKNELSTTNQYNLFTEILRKVTNPLILILIFSSSLSFFLGDKKEFLIIVSILFISILMDTLQEHNANHAARELQKHVQATAHVRRDGTLTPLPVTKLVPGDVIELQAGDIIPADCRLISSTSLVINQSALTGESLPTQKDTNAIVHASTALSNRDNCVFMGTSVASGCASALVVRTGKQTAFGTIAKDLTKRRPETEFERGSREFGTLISKTAFILVIVVFLINAVVKHTIADAFLFSLAIAIGMAPELLPVIISINLAKGAQRMAKRSTIVKHLPSIEIFGSMDILCTDKTGTLTQDHIRLERYENVTQDEDPSVLRLAALHSRFQTGIQNPLEQAILSHEVHHGRAKRLGELPFDFTRRLSSVVMQTAGETLIISKGAPESILQRCTRVSFRKRSSPLTAERKKELVTRFETLSKTGYRVLAVSIKHIDEKTKYEETDEHAMSFAGFLAFFDPPKEGAKEAITALAKQGITLKILTGDNELVTQKICDDLGVEVDGTLTGEVIEQLEDQQLQTKIEHTTIFARINPDQKERIITLFKKNHVVGFLGDGINDAPSLHTADVGISVNNATDVARESADIILLKKSLSVLHEGVIEGRKTYQNIMKYILMGSSANIGNMLSMAGASLLLPFLPMLPVQILLNDLLYDMSELSIPTDNVDEETIEKPRKWDVKFIRKFMIVFGCVSSLFDFVTFGAMTLLHINSPLFQTTWFIESLCSQTLIIFVIRTHRIPFLKSKPSPLLIVSSLLVVMFALLLPLTTLRSLFSFAEPPVWDYLLIGAIIIAYVLLTETVKSIFYKRLSTSMS
ncbi:magnesium-translocating P-type ATPase [Candidatus Cerribacteria bacterium 'Amazon FNV 2010 28 9']|uniref:Magnesium-transporting ATPase, P-type 1 n=1 Tax=Candidatus Cerribacteria bacterium 'Amazon FNV 2010 28 9' TaxID=2081795 RepID=A0A317JRW1_9BACT|nr:MAG: magnesium-translocating P-type ATPase [Candidatus Cerribacteria bacterium 'Amazon FNV 2010 28 9']